MKTSRLIQALGMITAALFVTTSLYGQSPSPVKGGEPPGTTVKPAGPSQQADPFIKDQTNKPPAPDSPAEAQKPAYNLQLIVETYALGPADAAELIASSANGETRHQRVLELAKAGKARFETLMSNVCRVGRRSTVEQVDELRYPTGFQQPQAVGVPAFPATFETRKVGETLEFESVLVPDHRQCDLNNVLSLVHFDGFHDYQIRPEDAPVGQPLFELRKITTSERLNLGAYQLLGTLNNAPQSGAGSGKPGEALSARLVFVRLDATEVTAEPAVTGKQPAGGELEMTYSVFSVDRERAREIFASAKLGDYYTPLRALAEASGNDVALLEKGIDDNSPESAIGALELALAHPKRVQLLPVSVARSKPGNRCEIEIIREFRYPTKYTPALDGTNGAPPPGSSKSLPASKPGKAPGYAASAFETRSVGLILDVETALGPNGIVEMNGVPQLVSYHGNLPANGVAASYPPQLWFQTRKIVTGIFAHLGDQAFVGTLNPPQDDGMKGGENTGRVFFAFVKTTLVKP